jgi:hypothetical protein
MSKSNFGRGLRVLSLAILVPLLIDGLASVPLLGSAAQGDGAAREAPPGSAGSGGDDLRIQPGDLIYLGAFRLPDDGERPRTFEYGGSAMTFRPGPTAEDGGHPGSLFLSGHDRMAYGELPDGSQLAEVSIPAPVISRDLNALPTAAFLQAFSDVAIGRFRGLDELPRMGLAWLDHPATGPKLHLAWGQHMPPEEDLPSHAWIEPDLTSPRFQGEWFIGHEDTNSVNGYLFEIPQAWADAHTGGRPLATGRFRDGGWSGMGPTLYAYRPWIDAEGSPAPDGSRLQPVILLQYASSLTTSGIERALDGYQHADEWEGGAWLTTPTGKSAVVFAGTKAVGEKCWYGFVNPADAEAPCVAGEFIGQYTACFLADGSPCPATDLVECRGHSDARGWWSTQYEAQIIFYDPAELAQVAAGQLQPWEPQPYAVLPLTSILFDNPAGIEPETLGVGPQRHHLIGELAFDRENSLLYLLELFADGAKPVVHVWRVE